MRFLALVTVIAASTLLAACAQPTQDRTLFGAISPSATDEKTLPLLGLGANIPLDRALTQMIPAGWTYRIEDGVPADTRVSWSGGRPWIEVLSDSLTAADLVGKQIGPRHISVMTKDKAAAPPVSSEPQMPTSGKPTPAPVSPAPTTAAAATIAAERLASLSPAIPNVTKSTGKPTPLTQPPAPPPSEQPPTAPPQPVSPAASPVVGSGEETWRAAKGSTLHQVLAEWAHRSGWDLSWSNPLLDYEIEVPADFQGDFPTAVRHLMAAYRGLTPRVNADVWPENHALVITITNDLEN